MKLNKFICILCASCVALITIVNAVSAVVFADESSESADGSDLWTAFSSYFDSVLNSYGEFGDLCSTAYDVVSEDINGIAHAVVRPKRGVQNFMYYMQDGVLWVDDTEVGGGGGCRPVSGSDDLYMDGETFAEICERLALQYAPDARTNYVSWQDNNNVLYTDRFVVWEYGKGAMIEAPKIYMRAFYRDENGELWHSPMLVRLSVLDSGINLSYIDTLSYPDLSVADTYWKSAGSLGFGASYAMTFYLSNYMNLAYYRTYADFLDGKPEDTAYSGYNINWYMRKSDDIQQSLYFQVPSFIKNKPEGDEIYDFGFYFDDEPIEMTGYIDPIPVEHLDDETVKASGDNIYEYTVVNNTTGDTTTINNYITNNYYYPDSGSGDGDTTINNNWDVSFGDFILNIGTTIENSINNTFNFLFVPEETYITNVFDDMQLDLETKIPMLHDAPDLFSSLFVDIVEFETSEDAQNAALAAGINQSSTTVLLQDNGKYVAYPKWEIDIKFFGERMKLTVLDFSTFAELLPAVRSVILVFVYVVYIWHFLQGLPSLIGNVVSAGHLVSSKISSKEENS